MGRMTRIVGVVGILTLMGGCAAELADDLVVERQDGLTIFSADPENGLTGMFAEGDRAFFFETVRTPGHVFDPELGITREFEISARVLDESGITVHAVFEGHGPEQWEEALEITEDPSRLVTLRSLLPAFTAAITDLALPEGMELEQSLFGTFTQQPEELEQEPAPEPGEVAYTTNTYRQYLQAYWAHVSAGEKWITQLAGCHDVNSSCGSMGNRTRTCHHTATFSWRYWYNSSGTRSTAQTWNYCNHGRCWNGSCMSRYSSGWGPYTTSPSTPGACSTVYGADHVCNDDTRQTMRRIKYNRNYSPFLGYCANWSISYTRFWWSDVTQ